MVRHVDTEREGCSGPAVRLLAAAGLLVSCNQNTEERAMPTLGRHTGQWPCWWLRMHMQPWASVHELPGSSELTSFLFCTTLTGLQTAVNRHIVCCTPCV